MQSGHCATLRSRLPLVVKDLLLISSRKGAKEHKEKVVTQNIPNDSKKGDKERKNDTCIRVENGLSLIKLGMIASFVTFTKTLEEKNEKKH